MHIQEFENIIELENDLADNIEKLLQESISQKNKAHILLSGGSTPKRLYEKLSLKELDWSKITIGLVDERHVQTDSPFSNEKMIKEKLLINHASTANFVSMIFNAENEKENISCVNESYSIFHDEIDLCILGMGDDGHTASLFPNDENSIKSLENNKIEIIATLAPNDPKNRISCSKSFILNSKKIILMIQGENKKNVLLNAKNENFPIAYFTESSHPNLNIYYSA